MKYNLNSFKGHARAREFMFTRFFHVELK